MVVCIYKYTEDAGDCWETFKGDNVPLWQVQIEHGAQRSITFRLREAFDDYLRGAKATDDALPISLAELEKVAGIRLVIGDQKDRLTVLSLPFGSYVCDTLLTGSRGHRLHPVEDNLLHCR